MPASFIHVDSSLSNMFVVEHIQSLGQGLLKEGEAFHHWLSQNISHPSMTMMAVTSEFCIFRLEKHIKSFKYGFPSSPVCVFHASVL